MVINSDIPNKIRIYDALSYVQSTTPITFEPVSINANGEIANSNYLRFVKASVTDDSCYTFAGMVSRSDRIFTESNRPFLSRWQISWTTSSGSKLV